MKEHASHYKEQEGRTHRALKRIAAASLAAAGVAANAAPAVASTPSREYRILKAIHDKGGAKEPNVIKTFKGGTRVYAAPNHNSQVVERVPAGNGLSVEDGIRWVDPTTHHVWYGFDRHPDRVHSISSLVAQEDWVDATANKPAGTYYYPNEPRVITEHISSTGEVTAAVQQPVNTWAETDGAVRITR